MPREDDTPYSTMPIPKGKRQKGEKKLKTEITPLLLDRKFYKCIR